MTLIDALNNPKAKQMIESIEDMRASWNGEERYADEIADLINQIYKLTGYRYTI